MKESRAGKQLPSAICRERREAMEEFVDVNMMFDLMRTPEGISPVEKLLNEFEAHEAKEDGIREYRTLAKESSGYYHGLFKILLDAMIRDVATIACITARCS
jgi:hypothetical protein